MHNTAPTARALTPYLLAVIAAAMLAPMLLDFQNTDRLALIVLALTSVCLLQTSASPPLEPRNAPKVWALIVCAGIAITLGLVLTVDKFLLLGGVLLGFCALVKFIDDLKAPWISLFCLLAVISPPAAFEADFAFWLAEAEAEFFVMSAQTLGMDVYRLGTQVVAGDTAVTINGDCSGTLLLWPTLLGFAVAAGSSGRTLGRTLLLLSAAVPFAFLLNLVRLLTLLVANFILENDAAEAFHDTLGWFVMPLAWALPILLISPSVLTSFRLPGLSLPALKLASTFTATLFLVSVVSRQTTEAITEKALSAPYYFDGWAGQQTTVSEKERAILGTNQAVRMEYVHTSRDDRVLVTFMVHSNQKKGQQHSSQSCYRTLGWIVEDLTTKLLAGDKLVRSMTVRNHQQVQYVTEYIDPTLSGPLGGFLRIQLVWPPNKTQRERAETLKGLLHALYSNEEVYL